MASRWIGPYNIHQVLDKGVCRLENASGVVLKAAVNQCRLKLYLPQDNDEKVVLTAFLIR